MNRNNQIQEGKMHMLYRWQSGQGFMLWQEYVYTRYLKVRADTR